MLGMPLLVEVSAWRKEGRGSRGERTAYRGFFVFLKVVVDEAED